MQPISADAVLQEFRNKVTRNIVWFIAGTTLLLAAVQGWMGHWWQTLMILVAGAIAAAVAELAAEMTWSQWINQTDTALLEAKKQGRNQVSQVPTGMPTHDRI